jgi:Arc/MetJ-type ribon-helix-helix transcriptional regulator
VTTLLSKAALPPDGLPTPAKAVRAGLKLLERQDAEDKAKIEWLRNTTQEAFAALDQGDGIPLSSAGGIDALVNGAIAELRTL